MAQLFSVLCICLCLLAVRAAPEKTPESRVHDGKLSDKAHYDKDGKHNTEYDHEAFLGKKEKKSFDQLTPAESRERLGKIVDKIDKDNDGKVSGQELQDWIKFSRMQNHLETVTNRWEDLKQREKRLVSRGDYKGDKNVNPNSPVSWETYKRISFGANPEKHEDSERLLKQMKVDERRWKGADFDYDNKLTKEEFGAFYHPWEYDHMHGIAAQDNLDDMDKDKDGRVSLQEYLDDLYRKSENELTKEQLKQREADIKYFHSHRDANKDGYLDMDEVKEWVFPTSYSHLEAEASHLIHHADADKDKQLTKEEILTKHDLFVGSRATNYGKDLEKHDEF